ncbi:phage integrase N-terminal domain-containing protein, partial [Francisella philomiragia]
IYLEYIKMAANETFRGVVMSALKHNKDGSFATQSNRKAILLKVCSDLKQAGHNRVTAKNFGAKHCYILRDKWKSEGISTATIKNRLACIRWLGEKIGKELPDNSKLEIENRVYSDNTKNKAQEIDRTKFYQLEERHQLSIELQREFGLRLEESIKFNVSYADKGDYIKLKSTWTKGGREREIPVRNNKQRNLMQRLHNFCGKNSLIPKDKNYIQAKWSFEKATQSVGIKNVHGFRHKYAQNRYQGLTQMQCPKAGGKTSRELTPEQKQKDYEARMIISQELGHGREEITVQYLGR